MKKKLLSLLLSAAMLLAVTPAALAVDTGFTDVASGVWYTDAVNYVAEHNLMDPVSGNSFAPNAEASRAALAVALYRAAGSPAVGAADFTDKTVIPFCTSSSSGLGESGELLAEMAGTGDWQEGRRFSGGVSRDQVTSWVESLK